MCKKDTQENYAFQFLHDVERPVVRLSSVGRESRFTEEYYWDNSNRWEHREHYLFQYTLSGSGSVRTKSGEHILEKEMGFFVKVPGPECYYFSEKNNEAPWEFLFVTIECDLAEDYCQYILNHLGNVFSVPYYSRAIQILLEVHSKAKEGNSLDPFFLSSRAFEFLCSLCALDKKERLGLAGYAREYFEKNYEKPIGVCDAAQYLKVSQSHLSREFYRKIGERPVEFLTKLRLKQAVNLLDTTVLNLEEISAACGFSSANYFTKVFRKYMGVSPNQFRAYVRTQGYSSVRL